MSTPAGELPSLEALVGAAFAKRIEEAAEAVRRSEGTARVIVDQDADGLSAGGILVQALARAGKRFHLTAVRGLDKTLADALAGERHPMLITSDLGSGQADLLEPMADAGTTLVILDHHVPLTRRNDARFFQVNGHLFGVDGTTELCGASTSFLFAIALSPANWDLVPLAIAGAIGDRQHVGGFKGAARRLVDAADRGGFVRVRRGLNLDGANVIEALVGSNDPFLPGITGDEAAARALLRELRIPPEAEVDALDEASAKRLASNLMTALLEHGVDPFYAEEVVTERVQIPGNGLTAKDLQNLINSAGRSGEPAMSIAVALGDKSAVDRARKIAEEFRQQVRAGLLKLAANPPKKLRAVQYFDSDNPLVAAAVAGLGVVYLFDREYPVVCFTASGNGGWKVSTRATRDQRRRGVDFSLAARKAAEAVGGRGGGHPVASGATIPREGRELFLKTLDEIVAEQLKAGAGAPPEEPYY